MLAISSGAAKETDSGWDTLRHGAVDPRSDAQGGVCKMILCDIRRKY